MIYNTAIALGFLGYVLMIGGLLVDYWAFQALGLTFMGVCIAMMAVFEGIGKLLELTQKEADEASS